MKTAIVFYFSGTGNTWFAAKTIASRLTGAGIDSKACSIERLSAKSADILIQKSDLAVFCYPVYASYIPKPMVRFIDSLAPAGKKSAVVCTQMIFSGDAAAMGAKLLAPKGFKTSWAFHINMPNNLNCGAFRFMPVTNDAVKLAKMRRRVRREIDGFVTDIKKNKPRLHGCSKAGYLLGRTQRPKDCRSANDKWDSVMSINQEDCTRCGLCYKICPMGNIKSTEYGYETGSDCTACMRCHNFCGSKAICFNSVKSLKESYRGPVPDFNPLNLTKH